MTRQHRTMTLSAIALAEADIKTVVDAVGEHLTDAQRITFISDLWPAIGAYAEAVALYSVADVFAARAEARRTTTTTEGTP